MKTISGLFDTHREASMAVEALEDAGIASDEISVVSSEQQPTSPPAFYESRGTSSSYGR